MALSVLGVVCASCVPAFRARSQQMCSQEADCGARAACVAGRCLAHGAVQAIDGAERLTFAPVAVAYLCRDNDARGAARARLGRAGERAMLLLRFEAQLAPTSKLLEAYVVLERAAGVPSDPAPVMLHAARVLDPWDERRVDWATRPAIEEMGSPVTTFFPRGGGLVRIHVLDMVNRWRAHARGAFNVAIVPEGASATGIAFALAPTTGEAAVGEPRFSPLSDTPGGAPWLELYAE